jgi:TetR/AcrR family transcriptional regulator, repressor for uid operon
MPRTVNPLNTEMRRREILDAAQACFERRGFHGSSMSEICAEAGISPGGLYRYFPSKESIIAAMAEDERRAAAMAFQSVRTSANFLQTLSQLCEHFAEAYATQGKAAFVAELMAEAVRNPKFAEVAREAELRIRSDVANLLRTGQEIGQIDANLDADEAAAMILAAADGLGLRMAFMGNYSSKAAATGLKNLVLRYLAPSDIAAAPHKKGTDRTFFDIPPPANAPLHPDNTSQIKSRAGATNET